MSGDGSSNEFTSSSQGDSPIRVHELAKQLQVTSREVIERCEPDDAVHPLTNSLSTVSSDEANAIRAMFSDSSAEGAAPNNGGNAQQQQGGGRSRRRRRRRRGGGNGGGNTDQATQQTTGANAAIMTVAAPAIAHPVHTGGQSPMSTELLVEPNQSTEQGGGRRSRRRKRGRRGGAGQAAQSGSRQAQGNADANPGSSSPAPEPQQQQQQGGSSEVKSQPSQSSGGAKAPTPKKRRALYRAGRSSVSPAAREGAANQDD